jgi:hypothetical protein
MYVHIFPIHKLLLAYGMISQQILYRLYSITVYDCTVYKNTDIHSIRRSSNGDIVSTDDDAGPNPDLENSSLLIQ